jgi:hypothetical protein
MFTELTGRVAGRFARVEPRRRAKAFVLGLLADLPRKNCWTIAEHAGDASPDGMQHLLARAAWDADGVRDDLRDYVVEHLGDTGAVLVTDETGDVKKGVATVGVQRQYSGTAGRVENCQVAVYLAYATHARHAFIDRELYLPASWVEDPARRRAAWVPDDRVFATKPALATAMIARALDAGVSSRSETSNMNCVGRHGDDTTNTAPAPATTRDKPPGGHRAHDRDPCGGDRPAGRGHGDELEGRGRGFPAGAVSRDPRAVPRRSRRGARELDGAADAGDRGLLDRGRSVLQPALARDGARPLLLDGRRP